MTHFVINQFAPDHATYGADAGKFLVTSEDLEHEFSGPMGEDDARTLASALNACQTVADRWERGDFAEAARLCAAVAEDVNGRSHLMTHDEIRSHHFARLNDYRRSAEYAAYAKEIGAEVPQGDLPSLIGDRWEIDGETYREFLEVLPPLGWKGGTFFMREFSFDDITAKVHPGGRQVLLRVRPLPGPVAGSWRPGLGRAWVMTALLEQYLAHVHTARAHSWASCIRVRVRRHCSTA